MILYFTFTFTVRYIGDGDADGDSRYDSGAGLLTPRSMRRTPCHRAGAVCSGRVSVRFLFAAFEVPQQDALLPLYNKDVHQRELFPFRCISGCRTSPDLRFLATV